MTIKDLSKLALKAPKIYYPVSSKSFWMILDGHTVHPKVLKSLMILREIDLYFC